MQLLALCILINSAHFLVEPTPIWLNFSTLCGHSGVLPPPLRFRPTLRLPPFLGDLLIQLKVGSLGIHNNFFSIFSLFLYQWLDLNPQSWDCESSVLPLCHRELNIICKTLFSLLSLPVPVAGLKPLILPLWVEHITTVLPGN